MAQENEKFCELLRSPHIDSRHFSSLSLPAFSPTLYLIKPILEVSDPLNTIQECRTKISSLGWNCFARSPSCDALLIAPLLPAEMAAFDNGFQVYMHIVRGTCIQGLQGS